MFRYTIRPAIRHDLLRMRRVWKMDQEYHYINGLIGTNSFAAHCAFSRHALKTVYYSPKRLTQVPVGGYLMPVQLFHEEEV